MPSCDKGCDNKYYNCPPRMADGRHFTDYRPKCAANFESQPHPMSSYDYRMFLTEHAEEIINKNREVAFNMVGCAPCSLADVVPENIVQTCNNRTCSYEVIDSTGLGIGRKEDEPYMPAESSSDSASGASSASYPF